MTDHNTFPKIADYDTYIKVCEAIKGLNSFKISSVTASQHFEEVGLRTISDFTFACERVEQYEKQHNIWLFSLNHQTLYLHGIEVFGYTGLKLWWFVFINIITGLNRAKIKDILNETKRIIN
jgi:hypothetical protein